MVLPGLVVAGFKITHSERFNKNKHINALDASGEKQGPWEILDDSTLVARGNYKDDKQDGIWTYWYPNGALRAEGHFTRGLKNELWVEWYADGEIMWKGEWNKGHRTIGYPEARAQLKFIGPTPEDNILYHDSVYQIQVRIMNIPADHLFVEASNGSVQWEDKSDLLTLRPGGDTSLILAIGYIPSFDFMDFRNLVSEVEYRLR